MYTIGKAKTAVLDAVRGYLAKDERGCYLTEERNRLPLYLEGAPGIGKTEIVEQVSRELGIGYVSFSLVHHTRNSLLGLPVIRELENGDRYTSYTMSEIIAKVSEHVQAGEEEGILLLDEFPCMSETIMPALLAFLQTKNIGSHYLPEGWVIVLCGNPPEYNKAARRMDDAILDRVRRLEIMFDAQCFIEYGRGKGLDDVVMSYLELYPDHAYRCEKRGEEQCLVTCRGWENLSHALRSYRKLGQSADRDFFQQFIKSEEIGSSFQQYYRQLETGFSRAELEEILQGKGFERNRRKLEEMDYGKRWKVMEYLCELLVTKKTEAEAGIPRYSEISGWMGNVLDMLEAADPQGIMSERAFQFINKNELLLKVVGSVRVPEYLKLCDRFLGDMGENRYA